MNVTREVQKIGVGIYEFSFEFSLKERAHTIIVFVDGFRIRNPEQLHGMGNVIGEDLDQEMVVVGHQGIGDKVKVCSEVFAHCLEKEVVVFRLKEDRSPVVATVIEVVIPAGDEGDFV